MSTFGLHIHRAPSGRFAFVGSIPACLAEEVDATKSDVLGGRAYRRPDGSLAAPRFPSFDTLAEAEAYAQARGITDYRTLSHQGPAAHRAPHRHQRTTP